MDESVRKGPVRGVRWTGDVAVAEVAGDVDLNCSPEFQQALLDLLGNRPRRIILDLAGVPYMDSSGVASLVKLLSRARRYGTAVVLASLTDRVRSILEITRLSEIFDIRASAGEAMI